MTNLILDRDDMEKLCTCSRVPEKHLSFDEYSVLNVLWRLTFRKGTRYSITLQELLDAFHMATPEYKTSPMSDGHLRGILEKLEKQRYIVADTSKHNFLVTLCFVPFVICR